MTSGLFYNSGGAVTLLGAGAPGLLELAATDSNANMSIDGSERQSINCGTTPLADPRVGASYAIVPSNTLHGIEDFTAASVAHAATLNPNDNARRLLLGTPRTVDQVEAFTNTWGSAHAHDFTTYQIEATFGRYGTLPIVVVSVAPEAAGADGFYLLVDGVNGMVDGPFAGGTVPAPGMLLSGHSSAYQRATDYKAVSAGTGCAALPVAVWNPRPPAPGYAPRSPNPALNPVWPPGTQTPAVYPWNPDPTRLGWWGNYWCVSGTGTCTCESYGESVSPIPGARVIILGSGACLPHRAGAPPDQRPLHLELHSDRPDLEVACRLGGTSRLFKKPLWHRNPTHFRRQSPSRTLVFEGEKFLELLGRGGSKRFSTDC